MRDIYLGLGSNVQPRENLKLAVRELHRHFDVIALSRVYRNKAVGFKGDDFLNAVALVRTDMSVAQIDELLDSIHDLSGRQRSEDAFVARTLDIDLLMVDALVDPSRQLPRSDVLEYSFVLGPLAEIAPSLKHPVTGMTMQEHWAQFEQGSHPLEAVDLILSNHGEPTHQK